MQRKSSSAIICQSLCDASTVLRMKLVNFMHVCVPRRDRESRCPGALDSKAHKTHTHTYIHTKEKRHTHTRARTHTFRQIEYDFPLAYTHSLIKRLRQLMAVDDNKQFTWFVCSVWIESFTVAGCSVPQSWAIMPAKVGTPTLFLSEQRGCGGSSSQIKYWSLTSLT